MRSEAARIFGDIYRGSRFGGTESASGPGSSVEQTRTLVTQLPMVLRSLGVRTLLDLPCGDFHWMRTVDLTGMQYIGGDIVPEMIAANQRDYGCEGRVFRHLDLLTDPLPAADLLLCRDCLVHFPFADAHRALANIKRSSITWLLTTTFPGRARNVEGVMGRWRPLNLQQPPFCFPMPQRVLVEGCTENGGAYADKALGLWRVADLP